MIKLFKESCDLCKCYKTVAEGNYIFEGEVEILEDGEEFPIPTFINSKILAKKWFKDQGWQYRSKCVFCEDCYKLLKNGYVILDRFNQFYDDEACLDVPTVSCIMNKQEAIEFSSYQYNDEVVNYYKALTTVSNFLNGKLETDSLGYTKEHPEVSIVLDF